MVVDCDTPVMVTTLVCTYNILWPPSNTILCYIGLAPLGYHPQRNCYIITGQTSRTSLRLTWQVYNVIHIRPGVESSLASPAPFPIRILPEAGKGFQSDS